MIPVLGVPTLTRGDLLARLVESIDHPVERLVIIDNGDQRQIDRYRTPRDVERVTVTRTAGNLGVAGSWNLIVKTTPYAPWWLIVNDDAWFPPGALTLLAAAARTDAVVLSGAVPPWSCFVLGEDVVRKVGLFDERFHPAYFEDNDYERRCQRAGVPVWRTAIRVNHDNSSTIAQDPTGNARTFGPNGRWHDDKIHAGDDSWGWDLDRRRTFGWDQP